MWHLMIPVCIYKHTNDINNIVVNQSIVVHLPYIILRTKIFLIESIILFLTFENWFVQHNLSVTSDSVHTVYSPQQILVFFLSHCFFLTHTHTPRGWWKTMSAATLCIPVVWLALPAANAKRGCTKEHSSGLVAFFSFFFFFISSVYLCQNA